MTREYSAFKTTKTISIKIILIIYFNLWILKAPGI